MENQLHIISSKIFKAKRIRLTGFLLFLFFSSEVFSQTAFFENKGQWEKEILYKSDFNSGKLYIEDGMLNYNFYDSKDMDDYIEAHHKTQLYDDYQEITINGHCLKTNFINSNKNLNISASEKIKEYANFYIGNEPSKWASKVSAFESLVLENLYNDIDLRLEVKPNGYKYDFIVKPQANENNIAIEYLGAEKIQLENGNLRITTSVNDIIEQKPYAYQIVDGEKRTIACQFVLKNEKVSFAFPEGFDHSKELIIDPYIVFSRISGSSADNFGYTATYDSKENAYGAGSVFSAGFITTPGAFDLTFDGGSTDVGVIKYSPDGLQRLFSTYLGGFGADLPHSLVVNSRDELYVFGTTGSFDFPTSSNGTAFRNSFQGGTGINFTGLAVNYTNGSDLFISRFREDGTALLASTYLGGSENDGLNYSNTLKYNYADEIRGEILMDKSDNCYIVSCTYSADFPIGPAESFQTTHGGNLDGIVVKMDENLSSVIWSTFLGGQFDDAAYSLDFDQNENLLIAGGTNSDDFPLSNPYQDTFGGGVDGFITRLHSSGAGLLSSTYLGTANYDQIYFVEANDKDEIHIFGQTRAPANDFIFNAAYNKPNGGQLLSKFNKTVDTLVWSTRFGDESGVPDISPTAFLVDVCDRVFLSGWGWGGESYISGTAGLDVTIDAIDNTTDNNDFYFMVLKDDASSLDYASFFGGISSRDHVDGGTSRFSKKGTIYQAVCASCGQFIDDFPIVPAGNNWNVGSNNCNLGVVKYAFTPPSVIADFQIPPTDCAPIDLYFTNTSQTISTQLEYIWNVNGQEFNTEDLDYSFNVSGVYEIQLMVYDTGSCNLVDSISKQLTIIGNGLTYLEDAGVCRGRLTQIGISPIPGNNVTYTWTPDFAISATDIPNPYINPQVDTTYQLIVSNGNCTDTFIQKATVGELNIEIEPFDTVCLESNITLSATNIEGALYDWEPEEYLISGQASRTATFYIENSQQQIGVTVTNLDGCTDYTSVNINTYNDLPDLAVFADPDTIESSQGSQLLAESIDGNSFFWEANNHFDSLNMANPYAENILETTTFKVSVVNDGDPNLCYKKDSVTVYVVIPECLDGKFYVPNAFSPNGDGNNDVFKVRTTLINIQDFYLAVYDRWGNKIFETKDKTEGWDGTYKGAQLSPNVYGWYTKGLCPGGEEFLLKGNVTLLK